MWKSLYTRVFTIRNTEWLILFVLAVTVIGMPLSRFMMSFGTVGIPIAWIISGNYAYKWNNLKQNKFLWPIMGIFVLHLLWIWRTPNSGHAVTEVVDMLPLLFFPFVIGSLRLSHRQIKGIFNIFVLAVIISTLISLCVYLGIYVPRKKTVANYRDISIFVSHIRLGVMCVMSVFYIIYTWYDSRKELIMWQKIALAAIIAWLLYFTTLIQAATSWVAAIVAVGVLILAKRNSFRHWQFYGLLTVMVGFAVVAAFYVRSVYTDMHQIRDTATELPKLTQQGNPYTHYLKSETTENGYYVYRYICNKELKSEWNKRSRICIDSVDRMGQPIRNTLMRYLTSKGLPKDSCGVWQLTDEEIAGIEKGYASCINIEKSGIYRCVYEVIWEIENYLRYNDANGKSVSMRIEFFKTGLHIVKKHLWLGSGPGSAKESFAQAYEETNSPLRAENRFLAHNQYLTFAISLGLIGFVLALICMFAPLFMVKSSNFLLVTFCTIMFVSMLDEDTLTRQLGCIMFGLFYAMTLLLAKNSAAQQPAK